MSAVITEVWQQLMAEKNRLEGELTVVENALDALRPVVGGSSPESSEETEAGPCTGMNAQMATYYVLQERPDVVFTNARILKRMYELGWTTMAKGPRSVSGVVSGGLRKNFQQGLVHKMGRGRWRVKRTVTLDDMADSTLSQHEGEG